MTLEIDPNFRFEPEIEEALHDPQVEADLMADAEYRVLCGYDDKAKREKPNAPVRKQRRLPIPMHASQDVIRLELEGVPPSIAESIGRALADAAKPSNR